MIDVQEMLLYGLTMGSAGCGAAALYPAMARAGRPLAGRVKRFQQVKVEQATKQLDDIFMDVRPRWLQAAYAVMPIVGGLLIFALTNHLLFAAAGAALGALLPDLWLRQTKAARRRKFQSQLVDILFVLSSSLRA